MKKLLVGLLMLWSFVSFGQLSSSDEMKMMRYEDSLGVLAYMIVNDSIDVNRFMAVKAFIPQFVRALKHKHSFDYPFKNLQSYISILYPPDSTFRIITWQVNGGADFRNYGAIQMNSEDLDLIPLIDRSETYPNVEDVELTPNEWFGAIYYRLMPIKTRRETKYLLFGFDNFDNQIRRKVLDVLSFKKGKPVFGAPIITFPEKGITKKRLVLQYYSGATTTLNYDESRKLIIYDHLIRNKNRSGDFLQVSDGSYEGFKIKKGKLIHIDKVFHLKMDEPLRPNPVLNGGKDIMGRTKG